jgi:hypothetical protein
MGEKCRECILDIRNVSRLLPLIERDFYNKQWDNVELFVSSAKDSLRSLAECNVDAEPIMKRFSELEEITKKKSIHYIISPIIEDIDYEIGHSAGSIANFCQLEKD